MKSKLIALKILLFLTLFTVSKQALCSTGEINLDALGNKCVPIEDFLEKENLSIETEDLLYLASNNGGIIEKDNYILEISKLSDEKLQTFNIQKSKLYISSTCLQAMEKDEKILLDKSKSIIVIIYNFNQLSSNNLPDIYFIIRQNNPDSPIKYINSKSFDFFLCHEDPIYLDTQVYINDLKYDLEVETPIDIKKITYAKKLKIDLFDPHSAFLNDICFKFTSENKKDVPLDSRFEDYYQNITLCNETLSSHYIGFNYSSEDEIFTFRCAYGFYKDEKDKKTYIDNIDDKMKFIFKTSNIKVITCFKELLNIRELIHNYGGFICLFVFLLQVILYISFSCKGTQYLEEEIQEMFDTAEKRRKEREMKRAQIANEAITIEVNNGLNTDERLQNSNNEIGVANKETRIDNKDEVEDEQEGKENIVIRNGKRQNSRKKTNPKKKKANIANPGPRQGKKGKTDMKKSKIHDNFDLKAEDENTGKKLKRNRTIEVKDNDKKKKKKEEEERKKKEEEERKKKEEEEEKEAEKKEVNELYDVNDDDLNEYSFRTACRRDKRNVCRLYWNALKTGHVLINLFCRNDDNNLVIIKISLIFMLFPINLTFNIFFFTSKNIKASYVRNFDDLTLFAKNLLHSFLSSIFTSVFLIILKFLCQTHSKIRELRKLRDLEEARKKNQGLYKCLKFKINIYFILSFIFILVFGYYIACFCAIFENTQIKLIEAMFTSWGLSLFYPFGVYLVSSIFRRIALAKKIRLLFRISKIIELY